MKKLMFFIFIISGCSNPRLNIDESSLNDSQRSQVNSNVQIDDSVTYNLNIIVSGYSSSIPLTFSDSENPIVVPTNGTHTINTIFSGEEYNYNLSTYDSTHFNCTVSNGQGIATNSDQNILVNCSPIVASNNIALKVNIIGKLNGNLVIKEKKTNLTKNINVIGNHLISSSLVAGADYEVELTSPQGYSCSSNMLTGALPAQGEKVVEISCFQHICNDPNYLEYLENSCGVKNTDQPCLSALYFQHEESRCLNQIIAGCMDENATNYNAQANEDDDSCQYPLQSLEQNIESTDATNKEVQVVFIIDHSQSMNEVLPSLKNAFQGLIEDLKGKNVTFYAYTNINGTWHQKTIQSFQGNSLVNHSNGNYSWIYGLAPSFLGNNFKIDSTLSDVELSSLSTNFSTKMGQFDSSNHTNKREMGICAAHYVLDSQNELIIPNTDRPDTAKPMLIVNLTNENDQSYSCLKKITKVPTTQYGFRQSYVRLFAKVKYRDSNNELVERYRIISKAADLNSIGWSSLQSANDQRVCTSSDKSKIETLGYFNSDTMNNLIECNLTRGDYSTFLDKNDPLITGQGNFCTQTFAYNGVSSPNLKSYMQTKYPTLIYTDQCFESTLGRTSTSYVTYGTNQTQHDYVKTLDQKIKSFPENHIKYLSFHVTPDSNCSNNWGVVGQNYTDLIELLGQDKSKQVDICTPDYNPHVKEMMSFINQSSLSVLDYYFDGVPSNKNIVSIKLKSLSQTLSLNNNGYTTQRLSNGQVKVSIDSSINIYQFDSIQIFFQ